MNDEDSILLPINIGHECQILVHDDIEIRQCQRDAFDSWIRPWKIWSSLQQQSHHYQDQYQNRHSFTTPWSTDLNNHNQPESSVADKNVCCYRWWLLDCLTDSVQRNCPYRSTFDFRTFLLKRDEVVLYYETFQCKDYPFGNLGCHISTWALVALILGTILLLVAIGLLAFYNLRIHRKATPNTDSNHHHRNKSEPVTDL